MTETLTPQGSRGWGDTLRSYLQPKMAMMVLLGLAAGTPFLLYYSALSYWLSKSDVDVSLISFFLWFGLAYSFKFLWAPVLDRFQAPGFGRILGQRRGWILAAQMGLILALVGQGATNPADHLWMTALFSLLTAFMSATQDIGIDAWRIEIAADEDEQAPLASAYQLGYRVGLIAAGGGALFLAGVFSWTIAYWAMGGIILVCACALFFVPEPGVERPRPDVRTIVTAMPTGLGFVLLVTAALAAFAIGLGLVVPRILDVLGISITRSGLRFLVLFIAAAPFVLAVLFLPEFVPSGDIPVGCITRLSGQFPAFSGAMAGLPSCCSRS